MYDQVKTKIQNILCPDKAVMKRWAPAKPTIVFDSYWRFAAERHSIFFKRLKNLSPPWTNDPILQKYKFTNAYRVLDRVSQFLIKDVIYNGPQIYSEVFFRIILFKLFNKIETWQLLIRELGKITWEEYSFKKYDKILTTAMSKGKRIYSAAYMMPSGKEAFGYSRKHRNHLMLIEKMMNNNLATQIKNAKSMQDAFGLMKKYPTIGDFLAYQLITDINYSELTNFSEMEFVVPGPGAHNGICKCFHDLGGLNEVELIQRIANRQEEEFQHRGIEFPSLFGRPLQFIDCQNLFCEVDKYARVAHPNVKGASKRKRIKQVFHPRTEPIEYWFPPKWGLNGHIQKISKLPNGQNPLSKS